MRTMRSGPQPHSPRRRQVRRQRARSVTSRRRRIPAPLRPRRHHPRAIRRPLPRAHYFRCPTCSRPTFFHAIITTTATTTNTGRSLDSGAASDPQLLITFLMSRPLRLRRRPRQWPVQQQTRRQHRQIVLSL